ncbi:MULTISPECIES: protein tyrosine phosphatase family protein [unclassified Oleiphilus]|uniref:protein tyrosine phosphatase family protein n=2 Tax=Oleiphilus TaxID=141450 RepID=UPI0009ECCB19|nr:MULTISPECIES: protein tyrosine phosphatase family protein [unclassified Oleiphilus]MCH2159908.1 protein tyrosine phosphatase family protein [Oleiphilaceae bacterium]
MSVASVSKTITTTAGYLVSLIRKYTPLSAKSETLEDIYNYLPISDLVTTSGQPSEAQFALIKESGFEHVINLAPANAENSLKDEDGTLADLGLSYTHYPVNFVKPSERKFGLFVEKMQELDGQKVWVHCAANMRVSAFMYRYRTQVLKLDMVEARQDLEKIWEPLGVWKTFISRS